MAAITGDFPIGPYTATWNSNSIGLLEGVVRHSESAIGLPIRAGLYGQSVLDYILQGASMFVTIVVKEWNSNTRAMLWPFGTSMGIVHEAGFLLGAGAYAKQLVLTAVSGTPAATEGPTTRTYPLTIPLPGHSLDATFGAVERNIPVVLAVLPEDNSGGDQKLKFYTDT